jgi:hypothetical protein
MLTPEKLERMPFKTITYYEELQEWVVKQIAERIGRTLKVSGTTEYQLRRLQEIGLFNKDLKKKISQITGLSEKEINKIFKDAGKTNLVADKSLFEQVGMEYVPFSKSPEMSNLTKIFAMKVSNELNNITQTMAFVSSNKMLNGVVPVQKYFVDALDLQFNGVQSGLITFDEAINNVVQDMTQSGVRTVDYESGRTNMIDVAVRRSVLGGLKDMTNKQAEINANIVGTTCFEITWHSGHRPSHRWGGRRFDTTGKIYPTEMELYEKYSDPETGEIGTLEDYNCYHEKLAVHPETPRLYSDERLAELEAQELEEKEYEGKTYNSYQARQKQRQLERTMRKVRLEAVGYDKAGNQTGYKVKKARYYSYRRRYQEFSKEMGLKTEYQRVYYDRLGRI